MLHTVRTCADEKLTFLNGDWQSYSFISRRCLSTIFLHENDVRNVKEILHPNIVLSVYII